MAARTSFQLPRDFFSALSSAFSEWCLIIVLYINALLSLLATKFARFCNLPAPCLLCSRLDHILGNDNPGFYRDLFCHGHKVEISSLAYCCGHLKLASFHEMCENCLNSCLEAYGENVQPKLVSSVDGDGSRNKSYEDLVKVPLLKKDLECMRQCSCCSQPFRNQLYAHWSIQSKVIGADVAEIGRKGYGHVIHQEGLKKISEEPSRLLAGYNPANHGYDRLSHIGYSELKITSDSESEVPFSDDDDGNVQVCGTEDLKEEILARCRQMPPRIIKSKGASNFVSDDMVPEKLIHPNPIIPEPSLSDAQTKTNARGSCDESSTGSTDSSGHGLEEINWSQVNMMTDPITSSETISEQVSTNVSKEKSNFMEIGDTECVSAGSNAEFIKVPGSTCKTSPTTNDTGSSAHLRVARANSFKSVLGNKGGLLSPRVSEIVAGKDSSRAHDELKSRLSQMSSSLGFEFSPNDINSSPRVSDASSSAGMQNIAKRISIERNNSWIEPYDISLVSEIEGETSIDRFKRQVEMDRKSMSLLYKELEEERSASAIAAQETMAMINRLQEEKATMQMEALQYLREMEEQAEYDQEAIQKLNELLTEREKEVLDLEAEIESYRKQFGDEPLEEKVLEPLGGSEVRENKSTSTRHHMIFRDCNNSNQSHMMSQDLAGTGVVKDPLLGFEDEKANLLECLGRLEKKLRQFPQNGDNEDESRHRAKDDGQSDKKDELKIDKANNEQGHRLLQDDAARNGRHSEAPLGAKEMEHHHMNDDSSENGQMEEEISSKNESSLCRDHTENGICLNPDKNSDIASLEDEVSDLNKRVAALEGDQKFLEHTINSLRNGNDGVQLVQEIACHLRELRRLGIKQRERAVA